MRLREFVKMLRVGLANFFIRRRLASRRTLSLTADYCSHHTESWTRHLGPLSGKPDLRLLEIGCFEGGSTLWFLQHVLTHPASTITCIDSFARLGGEPRFEHNMKISGLADKVRLIKGSSAMAMQRLREEDYDVVYIDGSHRAADVVFDAVQAWILLKPGGVMIFDDYAWQPDKPAEARPQMAVDAFLRAFAPRLELLHKGYQVILKKNPATPGRPGQP